MMRFAHNGVCSRPKILTGMLHEKYEQDGPLCWLTTRKPGLCCPPGVGWLGGAVPCDGVALLAAVEEACEAQMALCFFQSVFWHSREQ